MCPFELTELKTAMTWLSLYRECVIFLSATLATISYPFLPQGADNRDKLTKDLNSDCLYNVRECPSGVLAGILPGAREGQ